MPTIKKVSFILCFALLVFSCNKNKFKTNDTDFQHIYNDLIRAGNDAVVTMDTEVHSYTFELSQNKTITSFGYQSDPSLSSTDYVIEIIRNSDSSVIYSGAHQFSSTDISYVTPTSPINLQSGVSYTVNRIQTNWTQYITETIGHIVKTEPSDYPISDGVLTITETNFHDYGEIPEPSTFFALPRIDLVLN